MTREALENTITLLSAIGGSLNALIHLPALAAELGISLDWDDFSKITTATPVLCSIVPNGNRTVVDLHYAGGIPAVMKELESVTVSYTHLGDRNSLLKGPAGGREAAVYPAVFPVGIQTSGETDKNKAAGALVSVGRGLPGQCGTA